MREFNIKSLDLSIKEDLVNKVDNLTKPKGSLGVLEELAIQIGLIQHTLSPKLVNPNHLLFAADHGIVDEGVSLSPKEVTWQQIANFLKGGAGISFLCRQHNFKLNIVDSGVDYDFPRGCGVIDLKIAKGTKNFLYEAAMSREEMNLAIERGANAVDIIHSSGCNVICFGEMGIGNTSPSSLWMHYLGGVPLEECIGAGSGMVGKNLSHKVEVLIKCAERFNAEVALLYVGSREFTEEVIRQFGGYEMVMTIGGMLRAAELGMVILVDGFIMTNCILAASKLHKEVLEYAIFGHCGDEMGHRKVLDVLGAKPLLNLGFRLGEGTGAICAYPIVESAVRMINEMDSFAGAAITKYF